MGVMSLLLLKLDGFRWEDRQLDIDVVQESIEEEYFRVEEWCDVIFNGRQSDREYCDVLYVIHWERDKDSVEYEGGS